MSALKNPRHERFAQEIAKGKSGARSLKLAGYKPNTGNAVRLKGYDTVQARIAELLERGAKRTEVTLVSLTQELEEARELAIENAHEAAAVSATMGKAKLHGKIIDRVQHEDLSIYTEAEIEQFIAIKERAIARIGQNGGNPALVDRSTEGGSSETTH